LQLARDRFDSKIIHHHRSRKEASEEGTVSNQKEREGEERGGEDFLLFSSFSSLSFF